MIKSFDIWYAKTELQLWGLAERKKDKERQNCKKDKRFIAKNSKKRLAVTDIHSHASLCLLKTRFIAFESWLLQKVKALENADTVFRS